MKANTFKVLAVSDWHVPATVSYPNAMCRLLSSMFTQALFLSSTARMCLAAAHPTFGKRSTITSASPPRASDSGHDASEHMHIAKEDTISLDDVIAKFEVMQGSTKSAERILAAEITVLSVQWSITSRF